MSENTLTLSVRADSKAAKILQSLSADPVKAWAEAEGDYVTAAKGWAAAYAGTAELAASVGAGRTVAMALTVKALDAEAKGGKASTAAIESFLIDQGALEGDLSDSLPGQWRNAARLITDLQMDPLDRVTRWLFNNKPKGYKEALKAAKSGDDMVAFADKAVTTPRARKALGFEALPEIEGPKDSGDDKGGDDSGDKGGDDNATRGPGKSDKTSDTLEGLSVNDRIEIMLAILAGLKVTDLSDEDKAALSAHADRLTA